MSPQKKLYEAYTEQKLEVRKKYIRPTVEAFHPQEIYYGIIKERLIDLITEKAAKSFDFKVKPNDPVVPVEPSMIALYPEHSLTRIVEKALEEYAWELKPSPAGPPKF